MRAMPTPGLVLLLALLCGVAQAQPTRVSPGGGGGACALAGREAWGQAVSPFDCGRLGDRPIAEAEAMSAARAHDNPAEIRLLDGLLTARALPAAPADLTGSWRCRTLKAGGILPLTVYGYFSCRITERDGGLYFEKVSGSQRVSGRLLPRQSGTTTEWVLLGAGAMGDEPPGTYSAAATISERNEVGFLARLAPGRLRIVFPYPHYESTLDVMELIRPANP